MNNQDNKVLRMWSHGKGTKRVKGMWSKTKGSSNLLNSFGVDKYKWACKTCGKVHTYRTDASDCYYNHMKKKPKTRIVWRW